MKTVAFTSETRKALIPLARKRASEFTALNGIPCIVITSDMFDFSTLKNPKWVKAFLWDLTSFDTEQIIWKECDTVDLKPLGELPGAVFCAVKEASRAIIEHEDYYKSLGIPIDTYFNAGFFVATRKSIEMFNALKEIARIGKKTRDGFVEQTWFNLKVQEYFGGPDLMANRYSWQMLYGDPPEDTIMIQYPRASPKRHAAPYPSQPRSRPLVSGSDPKTFFTPGKVRQIELPAIHGLNASVIETPKGLLLCYRLNQRSPLVTHACCFLDSNFKLLTGTHQELRLTRNYNVRFCWHRSKLYMTTSYAKVINEEERIELREVEIDDDFRLTCRAVAIFNKQACDFPKQEREKNWQAFSHDHRFWYVHSFKPHHILSVKLETGTCATAYRTHFKGLPWNGVYGDVFHLSAPAFLLPEGYLSVFHSLERKLNQRRYCVGFYLFRNEPPFDILAISKEPVLIDADANDGETPEGRRWIFPMQFIIRDGKIHLFGGRNDNAVVVCEFSLPEILEAMAPVSCATISC